MWGAIGAGIGLLSSMNSPKSQTQTVDKSPWAPAAPWLTSNLGLGQNLQNQYMANPLSQAQKTAYGNSFALGDQYRAMMPQLAAGLNRGQFNRANPAARPTQTNFSMPQNLGMGSMMASQPFNAPTGQVAAPAQPTFEQQMSAYLNKQQQNATSNGWQGD